MNAKLVDGLYNFDGGKILITGIGPFAAYTSLLPHIRAAKALYNFGIAGALHDGVEAGVCHTVSVTSKLKWHPKTPSYHEPIQTQRKGLRLCTLDFPLYESPLKNELQTQFDLVDMEGYAIAMLAKEHQKPLTVIKVVSDRCNTKTSRDIQASLGALSSLLAVELRCRLETGFKEDLPVSSIRQVREGWKDAFQAAENEPPEPLLLEDTTSNEFDWYD